MRRVLTVGVLLAVLGLQDAQARPFTVEDLLATESLGQVQFDPTGRRLVFERRRPWRSAGRFDLNLRTPFRLSRLMVTETRTPGRVRALFDQATDAGYLAGPFAPDGRRMLIYRLRGRSLSAGVVTLATRRVIWLPYTPELPIYGRAAQWRSPWEVALIVRPQGDLPGELKIGWQANARLAQGASAVTAGRAPTRTRLGSGRFAALRPLRPASRLVAYDVRGGRARTLATGEFVDLEVSPDGRRAALIENREEIQPDADTRVYVALPSRRRALVLVDLDTGAEDRPCGARDINRAPLSWSPRSDRLLAAQRRPDLAWDGLELIEIKPEARACRPMPLAGLAPTPSYNSADSVGLAVAWIGQAPSVLARPADGGRTDLYRLSGTRPMALSAALPSPPVAIVGAQGDWTWVQAADGLWRVDASGHADPLGRGVRPVANPQTGSGRITDGPALLGRRSLTSRSRPSELIWRDGGETVQVSPLPAEAELLASDGRSVALLLHAPSGTQRLELLDASGVRQTVARLNQTYADVTPPDVAPIVHAGSAGEQLTSWLYLPQGRVAGARLPLVVIPYRGHVFGGGPPQSLALGAWNDWANAQILVGAGYAVLAPSLPYEAAAGEPAAHMADDILRAVDAALSRGDLDPERIALLGQSFGAFNAVAAATQSPRFRSVVASAGVYDEISLWGSFPWHNWLVPEDGYSPNPTAGIVEHAQTGMGGPPWADPQRYVRNSVIFAADRIQAPVLILHGQADPLGAAQAQELFTALYRQGKDAQLVTYWGEGHTTSSPANIRDRWAIILEWLARTMGPPQDPGAPHTPPRSAARPRPSGRS